MRTSFPSPITTPPSLSPGSQGCQEQVRALVKKIGGGGTSVAQREGGRSTPKTLSTISGERRLRFPFSLLRDASLLPPTCARIVHRLTQIPWSKGTPNRAEVVGWGRKEGKNKMCPYHDLGMQQSGPMHLSIQQGNMISGEKKGRESPLMPLPEGSIFLPLLVWCCKHFSCCCGRNHLETAYERLCICAYVLHGLLRLSWQNISQSVCVGNNNAI